MRRSRFSVALVAVVAAAALWLSGCSVSFNWSQASDDAPTVTPAQLLEQATAIAPAVPVVVPVRLPDGYRYLGATATGDVVMHDYTDFDAWMQICVYPKDRDIVGACVPTAQPDTPVLQTVPFGDYLAAIVVSDDEVEDGAADLWSTLPLTDDWESPAWTHN